ncbi:A24 family peptidase [Rahnella sp. AA]|uniref:prepilin peptidase n=1 Tax=Rahnella sp. AA TaxID=2057180 RepID=UPI001E5DA624|nr:A24 family peptidase [Rahnella sp. AA]
MAEFILFSSYPILALIVGLVIGSFLNVVIYRLPLMILSQYDEEESIKPVNLWWPPSHCPQCEKPVLKRDNIPVISWLLLKGKCRFCKTDISPQYPITEGVVGLWFLFMSMYLVPRVSVTEFVFCMGFFCILYTLAAIDVKTLFLPDPLVFMLLWGGILASVFGIIPVKPQQCILGVVVSWGLTYTVMVLYEKLRHKEGLGYGDVKLYAAVSAWLGLDFLPELILISAVLGGFFYLVMWGYYEKVLRVSESPLVKENNYIPFGPAIAVAALILFHVSVVS